jgi:hypothetical protein
MGTSFPFGSDDVFVTGGHPSSGAVPSWESAGGLIHFGTLELVTNHFGNIDIRASGTGVRRKAKEEGREGSPVCLTPLAILKLVTKFPVNVDGSLVSRDQLHGSKP